MYTLRGTYRGYKLLFLSRCSTINSTIATRAISQYLTVIFTTESTNRVAVILPRRVVTIRAERIKVSETSRKFFFDVLSRKSIKKPVPRIRSIEGKIISLLLINSKLFIRKRSNPTRKNTVPVNSNPCCFPPNERYTRLIP